MRIWSGSLVGDSASTLVAFLVFVAYVILGIVRTISVAFRSAKERHFRGAKGDIGVIH